MQPNDKPTPKKWNEDQIVDWLVLHSRTIVLSVLILLAGVGSYSLYYFWQEQKENKAFDELFVLEQAIEKKQQQLFEEENKKLESSKVKKTDPLALAAPEKSPESLAKNFSDELSRLKNFISRNSSTKASYQATLLAADLFLDYKNPQEAVTLLENALKNISSAHLFYGLVSSQLAAAYSNNKECEKAITIYNKLLEQKNQKHFHSQSFLRKGACLVDLGRWDEAQLAFRAVRTEFPDTSTAEIADSYEKLVLLKKNQDKK